MRPGMEPAVRPGNSVAELGVIGRPEHMHAILDEKTKATLESLDHATKERREARPGADAHRDGRPYLGCFPPCHNPFGRPLSLQPIVCSPILSK